jgi:hypothetical protein
VRLIHTLHSGIHAQCLRSYVMHYIYRTGLFHIAFQDAYTRWSSFQLILAVSVRILFALGVTFQTFLNVLLPRSNTSRFSYTNLSLWQLCYAVLIYSSSQQSWLQASHLQLAVYLTMYDSFLLSPVMLSRNVIS